MHASNLNTFAEKIALAHQVGEKWKISLLSKEWDYTLKLGSKDRMWFAKFKPMGFGKCEMRERNGRYSKVATLAIESGENVLDALCALACKVTKECIVNVMTGAELGVQTVLVAELFKLGRWIAVYEGAKDSCELERTHGQELVGTRWV